jgi:diacylglycerol kinase (CTP)
MDDGIRRRGESSNDKTAKLNGHTNGHATTSASSTPSTDETDKIKHNRTSAVIPVPIDWEIPRKTLHSSIGFLSLWLWRDGSPHRVVFALSSALAVVAPTDVVRLRWPRFARVYERLLGFLMRESEKTSSNGVIWYLLGAIIVLHFLPLDIATVSILILSWADTAASTFGRLWGRYTPPLPARVPVLGLPLAPRKSLAGFIAACVTGAAAAVGFWRYGAQMRLGSPQDISWTFEDGFRLATDDVVGQAIADAGLTGFKAAGWLGLGLIGLTAGVVSGIAEALDLGSVDDNLSLPVISGVCLWAFFKVMSYIA